MDKYISSKGKVYGLIDYSYFIACVLTNFEYY